MGAMVLVTGGARSGKSRFAEALASAANGPVVYLATMEALDAEVSARIERHRARRPAAWRTVEAPIEVAAALRSIEVEALVLVDCVNLWVTNLIIAAVPDPEAPWGDFEAAIETCIARARELIAVQAGRAGTLVVVTNESGSGIVPEGALSRAFRDALGLVNQAFAAAADEVHLLVSGLPLRLK